MNKLNLVIIGLLVIISGGCASVSGGVASVGGNASSPMLNPVYEACFDKMRQVIEIADPAFEARVQSCVNSVQDANERQVAGLMQQAPISTVLTYIPEIIANDPNRFYAVAAGAKFTGAHGTPQVSSGTCLRRIQSVRDYNSFNLAEKREGCNWLQEQGRRHVFTQPIQYAQQAPAVLRRGERYAHAMSGDQQYDLARSDQNPCHDARRPGLCKAGRTSEFFLKAFAVGYVGKEILEAANTSKRTRISRTFRDSRNVSIRRRN